MHKRNMIDDTPETSSLNGIAIASVPDVFTLHYMIRVRRSLSSIAGWPHNTFEGQTMKSRISSVYRCVLIVLCSSILLSETTYLKKHTNTDWGHMYLSLLLDSLFLQRLFIPFERKFCLVLKKFILEFHLIHHRQITDYAIQVYDTVNRICSVISSVSHLQVVFAVIFYNGVPLYNSFQAGMFSEHKPQNGTFQHSVDYELPFDQYTSYRGYFIVFYFNWFISYNVAVGICIYDLLVFTIVFHIWGHLNILSHDLKYFSQLTPQCLEEPSWKTTQITQKELSSRLKDIIKHHQMIKEFMSKTSEAFSATLCCYFFFHQFSGCVLLLKCFSMEPSALSRYGVVTLILFQQLIQTSVIFELIRSKGDTLADEVYALPWESMDTRSRRLVLVFLHNVQPSLALKAGGMIPVGVLTMSTILKTSFSYFIILRTFTQ